MEVTTHKVRIDLLPCVSQKRQKPAPLELCESEKTRTGKNPCPVSVGKDKNRKNPLQRMGLRPAVRLSVWSYKSKLLTPKLKACQHLLAEGIHPLQGDKQ